MAKASTKSKTDKVSFRNLLKIWLEVALDNWVATLIEARPDCNFKVAGGSIKGNCIFHAEQSGSMIITPSKGLVKCFGCGKFLKNPIKFAAAIWGCSYGEAMIKLKKQFGLRGLLPEAVLEKHREYEKHQELKKNVIDFFCKLTWNFMVDVNFPAEAEKAVWPADACKWLKNRQLAYEWPTYAGSQLFAILPPRPLLEQEFGPLSEEVAWAKAYFAQYWSDHTWLGSIMLISHDEPESISRIKLRRPDNKTDKTVVFVADPYDADNDNARFFGLNHYRTFLGRGEDQTVATTAHLVEGEFDAVASIGFQTQAQSDDFIILSAGGGSAQGVDSLAAYGIKTVKIIGDNDNGGASFVKRILTNTETDKIGFKIFKWPDEYTEFEKVVDGKTIKIKDADDAVKHLGYAKWARYVTNPDCYLEPQEWAFDQASHDLRRCPADDVRQRSHMAQDWGKILRNTQECKAFCDTVARNYDGIDSTILYREIRAKDEDEEGFIHRLREVLSEHYVVVGLTTGEHRKRVLNLWDPERYESVQVVLNDETAAETTFSHRFGPIYDFVRDYLGDPAFMAAENEKSAMSLGIRRKKYREYLTLALLELAKNALDIDLAPKKAQGLHVIGEGESMVAHIVNGKAMYKLTYPDGVMKAEVLRGPRDGDTIFVNGGDPWIASVRRAEDLLVTDVDPQWLYKEIRNMVDIGWAWKYQVVDVEFLTAYTMCAAIMSVFPRQTFVMLNAEASSGKSRFVTGFIGGGSYPRINVVAAAKSLNNYTAASISQSMTNSSLMLCLDEFEDKGGTDKKSLQVRDCLELLRDMISETAIRVIKGTTSGVARQYSLRFPLMAGAIHPLREQASLTRFVCVELRTMKDRRDPNEVLIDAYGENGIKEIRHKLGVGLLRHMPAIQRHYREIVAEFNANEYLPAVATRFKESLYPIMAMQKFLGLDYKKLAQEFCNTRKDTLARMSVTSENEQIFETLLSTSISITRDEGRVSGITTIRNMLAADNPDSLDEINRTQCGVYFDKATNWLIVHWTAAVAGVLQHTKYKTEDKGNYLKQISERSPHHIDTVKMKEQRVLERMRGRMGPGVQSEHVSVFNVKHLIDEAAAHRREFTDQAKVKDPKKKNDPTQKSTAAAANEAGPSETPLKDSDIEGDDDIKV